MPKKLASAYFSLIKLFLILRRSLTPMVNNWYTSETQPIDPFVLEGLPLFTILP